jgi:hypothetical protein
LTGSLRGRFALSCTPGGVKVVLIASFRRIARGPHEISDLTLLPQAHEYLLLRAVPGRRAERRVLALVAGRVVACSRCCGSSNCGGNVAGMELRLQRLKLLLLQRRELRCRRRLHHHCRHLAQSGELPRHGPLSCLHLAVRLLQLGEGDAQVLLPFIVTATAATGRPAGVHSQETQRER